MTQFTKQRCTRPVAIVYLQETRSPVGHQARVTGKVVLKASHPSNKVGIRDVIATSNDQVYALGQYRVRLLLPNGCLQLAYVLLEQF